jgi:hypothetical protein
MEGVPFSPADVDAARSRETPPPVVFNVINMLLTKAKPINNTPGTAPGTRVVYQKDIEENVRYRLQNTPLGGGAYFKKEWLDFEDAYVEKGWTVGYEVVAGQGRYTFTPIAAAAAGSNDAKRARQ